MDCFQEKCAIGFQVLDAKTPRHRGCYAQVFSRAKLSIMILYFCHTVYFDESWLPRIDGF